MARGNQDQYNRLLDTFSAKSKTKSESVAYLVSLCFSPDQAENAVHVYWKGGGTKATFILSKEERDRLLDNFNAAKNLPVSVLIT